MSDKLTDKSHDSENWNLDPGLYDGEISSAFTSEGRLHQYPARAIPEIVSDLLEKLKARHDIKSVLDPFVGSGTVALETKIMGIDFYGSDLNPLAILLSRTKALTIKNTKYFTREIEKFINELSPLTPGNFPFKVMQFHNIDYWFKTENILQLSMIRVKIDCFLKRRSSLYREAFALILLTAFSSTVRESSLSRKNEFKLYRIASYDIENFAVDSREIFTFHLMELLKHLKSVKSSMDTCNKSVICLNNAKELTYLTEKIDVVLTSPPYGDSASTVAYGQFSKLSILWMSDLLERYLNIKVDTPNVDERLLGGKDSVRTISCNTQAVENSVTLRCMLEEIDKVVDQEETSLHSAACELESIRQKTEQTCLRSLEITIANTLLLNLIKERLRLHIKRKLNSNPSYNKQITKRILEKATNRFWTDIHSSNLRLKHRKINVLRSILPAVKESLIRKLKYLPARKHEVKLFFFDLYSVVERTHEVLSDNGFQVWIVGHRTVLGRVQVNLTNILLEWFKSFGYLEVTALKRKCSFKRMPHHINSTLTREQEIKTMLEEYILVVRKT